MVNLDSTNSYETKKRKKRNKGVIKFEEETVKKENAVEVLERKTSKRTNDIRQETQNEIDQDLEINNVPERKKKKKSKKTNFDEEANSVVKEEGQKDYDQDIDAENVNQSVDSATERRKKQKSKKRNFDGEAESSTNEATESKSKKSKKSVKLQESDAVETKTDVVNEKLGVKPKNSKRAQKKMKHAKLLEEKKLKDVVATQQTVLNYLSKWKHCREEWKFEKRKQIWLSQNMLDCSKIPNEFWETAVEYFSGAKGFIRKLVLRDALKVIEDEEKLEEENVNKDQQTKVQRARDIIQNLQE